MWEDYEEATPEVQALVAYAIARGKREILADVGKAVSSRGDVMPLYPQSFSELHDYVDANEYGGLCDGGLFHLLWNHGNEVQGALNGWLQDRYNGAVSRGDV